MPGVALEPLLSLKLAAQVLGLAEVTVRKMVRQGKLVGVHLGRRLLFEPETLRHFIARNRTAPKSCTFPALEERDRRQQAGGLR